MKKILIGIVIVMLLVVAGYAIVKRNNLGRSAYIPMLSSTASSSSLTITSDAQILATSTSRRYARVVNGCSSAIYITANADEAVSLTTGFYIAANGGSWDTDVSESFLYTGALRASSTAGACSIYVEEY